MDGEGWINPPATPGGDFPSIDDDFGHTDITQLLEGEGYFQPAEFDDLPGDMVGSADPIGDPTLVLDPHLNAGSFSANSQQQTHHVNQVTPGTGQPADERSHESSVNGGPTSDYAASILGEQNSVSNVANSPSNHPDGASLASGYDNYPQSPDSSARPSRSRSGSVQSNKSVHDQGSINSPGAGSSRSGSQGRQSASPHSYHSRSGSAGSRRSRSGSAGSRRSRSGSVRSNRSGSVGSHRSRSGSAGSHRSRSGSAGSLRSRSGSAGSHRSRSGSAGSRRSRSGSAGSRRSRSGSAGSRRSRSGSAGSRRSRSGSAGSRRSRSGSAGSHRSRSGSAGSRRSRSGSAGSRRSRSGSAGSRRSRSGSAGSRRSRSGSPGSRRSRSGSRHHSGSRSRSSSPKSRSGSRSRSRSIGSRAGSPSRSDASSPANTPSKKAKRMFDSEDEESEKEDGVGELIADIFGESDEEEEFEGFKEADLEKKKTAVLSDDENEEKATGQILPELSDSDEENDAAVRKEVDQDEFVSDFDAMLARKKEESGKRRKKRHDVDIINDNDDLIAALIVNMKQAAEDDRELNKAKKPAIKKLSMLPKVMKELRKHDLHIAFLDQGILSAMTEWLAPLPDKSLPHLQIRTEMLQTLIQFPSIQSDSLKTSGVGKAVMYCYKHPKEIRANREICGKLINDWSRPIFNLTSNYKSLSREEREQRDYEQLPKKRRLTVDSGMTPRRDINKALADSERALRPGDKGWVMRARVPNPSHKDYVVRPKWNVEDMPKGPSKRSLNRFEKKKRELAEKKKQSKAQKAVSISIEGRGMAL